MLGKLLRWLDSPAFPFNDLYLCSACELVFVGLRHQHCESPLGPHLLHLATHYRRRQWRILQLEKFVRTEAEKTEPEARKRHTGSDTNNTALYLTEFRER